MIIKMKKRIAIYLTSVAMVSTFFAFIPEFDSCKILPHSEPWEWNQTCWGYCSGPNQWFMTGGCDVYNPGSCLHIECDTENPDCTEEPLPK